MIDWIIFGGIMVVRIMIGWITIDWIIFGVQGHWDSRRTASLGIQLLG